jgi:hypothetical protein
MTTLPESPWPDDKNADPIDLIHNYFGLKLAEKVHRK